MLKEREKNESVLNKNVTDLFNNELTQFYLADNYRSIPNVIDGLKPSQRKILFTVLKSGSLKEEKVAQLASGVAKITAYRHGEQSLQEAIVSMAQDFVGSNNLNYLLPIGQFGTRIAGGSDHSSARYIFVETNPLTRLIFKQVDDILLDYLEDDGIIVEPKYYLPIIPTALLNGSEGIGTGWSTKIPPYNPLSLIDAVEKMINDKKLSKNSLHAFWRGFTGEVFYDDKNYITKGKFIRSSRGSITVTELPIKMWIDKFIQKLDILLEEKKIKDFRNNSSDTEVKIIINIAQSELDVLTDNDIISLLGLESTLSRTNMNFIHNDKVHYCEDVFDIINLWFPKRLEGYIKRKEYLLHELKDKMQKQNAISKFILLVIDGSIRVIKRKKEEVIADLKKYDLDMYTNYLLNMPIWNLTLEKNDEAINKENELKIQIKELTSTRPEDLWLEDLNELKKALKLTKQY